MKVMIVDDDPEMVENLKNFIKRFEQESETGERFQINTYSDGVDASHLKTFADIVLLDISMPHIDGLKLAKHIRRHDNNCVIIFITSMAQYAIDGYSVDALDFLLKPLSYATFKIRMKRAVDAVKRDITQDIIIISGYNRVKRSIKDITYVESNKHRLFYHTTDEVIESWGTMKEIKEQLENYGFVLCNSCYLVNLRYVENVTNDEVQVNGEKLKISRSKKKELVNALMEFLY